MARASDDLLKIRILGDRRGVVFVSARTRCVSGDTLGEDEIYEIGIGSVIGSDAAVVRYRHYLPSWQLRRKASRKRCHFLW